MIENNSLADEWRISKLSYELFVQNKEQMLNEEKIAFAAFRNVMSTTTYKSSSSSIALGGLSHSGQWSVFLENELWVVCIGENGVRFQPSFFTSIWDALNFIGLQLDIPKIAPSLSISPPSCSKVFQ
jgi:hypothetical protein